MPGQLTDVQEAAWRAQLLELGLLRRSFVPPAPQRELGDVVRYRKRVIETRAREANRLQKVLETANIKLSSVVTDMLGVSARGMLKALIAAEGSPDEIARLGQRALRHKRAELGAALTVAQDEVLARLDAIPGVGRRTAEVLVPPTTIGTGAAMGTAALSRAVAEPLEISMGRPPGLLMATAPSPFVRPRLGGEPPPASRSRCHRGGDSGS